MGELATLLGAHKCFKSIKEHAALLFLLTLLRVPTHPSSRSSSYFANPPHFLRKMHTYLILLLAVFYLFTDHATHIHAFLYRHLLPTHKLHGKTCRGLAHLSASWEGKQCMRNIPADWVEQLAGWQGEVQAVITEMKIMTWVNRQSETSHLWGAVVKVEG